MKFNNYDKKSKILLSLAVILTLFRIFLALKLPLFLQADAFYDDFLFIKYANYLAGIPYSLTLILIYIFSVFLFIISIKKLINSKFFLFFTYIFLLFSPIMFHVENVQKVYRGGLIVSFVLIIISSIIGIYTRVESEKKDLKLYIILCSISLSFFWFLKEDSIWILPFVVGGIFLSIIKVIKNNNIKNKRIFVLLLPLIILFLSINVYKSINYIKYKEFAITDRNGTYFKKVIGDLIKIEDEKKDGNVWITKNNLNKAYEVSPTLSKIKDEMGKKYDSAWADYNGEIRGDLIFWVLKEAVDEEGIYKNGGKSVNEFYKNVYEELENAYKTGKLKKDNYYYVSNVVGGINSKEINDYKTLLKKSKNMVITYRENETGLYESTGSVDNLALFNEITGSLFIMPNSNIKVYKPSKYVVSFINKITLLYQNTGKILYYIFIIELSVLFIKNIFIKKKNDNDISVNLIMLGLFVNILVLFFATTFFCRFLSLRKIYDYVSALIPLLEILECISLYYLIKQLFSIKIRK